MFVFAMVVFGVSFAFSLSGAAHTAYALIGCLIGGVVVIIDSEWIAAKCDHDDPLLGALLLYIDIIKVFVYISFFACSRR